MNLQPNKTNIKQCWKDKTKELILVKPVYRFKGSWNNDDSILNVKWLNIGSTVVCLFNKRIRAVVVKSVSKSSSTTNKHRVEVQDGESIGYVSMNDILGVIEND